MRRFKNSYLVTAEEMRSLDATAINKFGIPGIVLMENAGRSTFETLLRWFEDNLKMALVSVVAGPGNNGGDGFVISRYLINWGANVETFLLSPRDKIKGDARTNLNILDKMGASIHEINSCETIESATSIWAKSDIVVDAILGTGLKSEVRQPYKNAITKINTLKAFKLSVDIPSGVNSDTGAIQGVAISADLTVTFGFQKIGMATYPGQKFCGQMELIDIGIPQMALKEIEPKVILYNEPSLKHYLQIRSDPVAHKGTFGRALIVGASTGKTGAAAMAAKAASRIGAGLVTVAVPSSLNAILENKLTEEMTAPLPDDSGCFSPSAADHVLDLIQDKDVVAVGPGLSVGPGPLKIVQSLLSEYRGMLIIDADGLNCLAQDLSFLCRTKATVVLTPHPGEMGRILGLSSLQVQENRLGLGREFVKTYKCWLVLKGAGTIVFSPDGKISVNSSGNPWMSSGGQGDILTGILAGLIAQKLSLEESIPFGVWLHGHVADSIVKADGLRPVIATDVLKEIPSFLQILANNYTE